MAGDDSLIQSDEEEEVKMIENDFKKKKERIKKSELEELEQMIERKNKEDRTHGRSASGVVSKFMSKNQIDEEVIKRIQEFGYPHDFVFDSLTENKLNYATTSYYLYTL